jgi:hypothetical protein
MFTPGRLVIAASAGHAGWAVVAYGSELRGIAAAGLVDTVGDGIFRRKEDRGARAAAFWFAAFAPMVALAGWLVERAPFRLPGGNSHRRLDLPSRASALARRWAI